MIQTEHTYLRLINEFDVDFILFLRLNPNLNKFLSVVNGARNEQLDWITNYKQRENDGVEYYFIIMDKQVVY